MIAGRNFPRLTKLAVSRGVWGVVLSGVLVSGSCWLSAADEAAATGLRGILPASTPSDLPVTISALPENWKQWGTGLTAELATLYETEGVDVSGQRKAIAALRARLATVDKHAADARYRSMLKELVSLSGSLKRRLDTAEAALDTLELGPDVRGTKVAAAGKSLASAAQSLDTYLTGLKNNSGASWTKYLQVREIAAGAATDADATTAAAATVQARLKEKDKLADERAREFLTRPAFAPYEQALDSYLAAVGAPVVAANNPELRKSLADLLAALEQYEDTHSSAASAAARKAFEAVRGTAPDRGDTIAKALRNNYFNYNLRVVATEAFLSKLAGQSRNDTGPVRDFILGADVYGSQATHTDVTIDVVPSRAYALFEIVANGHVNANTQGVTDQATVYTFGDHYYTARKRIGFNGSQFWTSPATISVSANNTTTGADTNYGLFNVIARGIAVRKAQDLRGESEAIAASRLQDRVLPEFNAEVDKQFAPNGKNSRDVTQKLDALRQLNLYPDAESWSTTDTELKVATRLMAAGELGGSDPHASLVLGRGATILLHESVMNNAADRLELAGKTMTEDELTAKLEGNFSTLLGREVKFKKKEKPETSEEDQGPKTFVFDKSDPLRVQVGDGTLTLTLRAGFKQEGKEDIPTQIVTVPMQFAVDMKNVVIEPGNVGVAAAEQPDSPAKQVTRAGVIKKKIENAFARTELDRVRYLTIEKKKVLVAVTRIRALDGWLSITVE